jgi:hypothetical protein
MRKAWIATIAIGALVVATAGVVVAGVDQYRPLKLNRQNLGLIAAHDTSRTDFFPVRSWGFSDGAAIRATGGIAVTVSVTLSGAPAEFKVITESGRRFEQATMRPGVARFAPATGRESFSFTWVAGARGEGHTVNLFWRSPTGDPVTLHGGSVVIQYAAA